MSAFKWKTGDAGDAFVQHIYKPVKEYSMYFLHAGRVKATLSNGAEQWEVSGPVSMSGGVLFVGMVPLTGTASLPLPRVSSVEWTRDTPKWDDSLVLVEYDPDTVRVVRVYQWASADDGKGWHDGESSLSSMAVEIDASRRDNEVMPLLRVINGEVRIHTDAALLFGFTDHKALIEGVKG